MRGIQALVPNTAAWYREFAPCKALQNDVEALFSFVPEPSPSMRRVLLREVAFHDARFCSPQFADGQVSLVFELGRTCDGHARWSVDSKRRGTVIGPMSTVGRTEGDERPEMLGVYFRPARAASVLRVAISELTDKAVGLDDVWGSSSARLIEELSELDEMARIDRLESILLARLGMSRPVTESIQMERLAASVFRRRGLVTVEELAHDAGVSRQYLTRQFRARFGVGPKLYCRLARFQSALVYAGCGARVDWAHVALGLGHADQSHMIAELRQFSGLTPRALASRDWFHPFIERYRHTFASR